ncbi:6-bladed beta-propeller [Parabacteroides sp. OttesenSCG-928-G07]|nr:6-bladed beta-propeller [Parabacteroides sp. OttesenSCG-928-G21]MDL2278232.1 6-bladed beta-propeller [Parabacteroides sp. OttesenSCG-928-G07]
MRGIYHLFLLALFTGACFSCQNAIRESSSIIELDLGKVLSEEVVMTLDNISTSVETVALETNDKALIKGIDDVILNDKYILILEYRNCYLFDRTGKFLRSIGTSGQGPNEFTTISNAFLKEDEVILFDGSAKRILRFGIDGEYIDGVKLPTNIGYLSSLSENQFVGYIGNVSGEEPSRLKLFDDKGTVLDSIPYPIKFEDRGPVVVHVYNECWLYSYNNELRMKELFYNTIYKINENFQLDTLYTIDLGTEALDPAMRYQLTDPRQSPFTGKKVITTVFETDRYLFLLEMRQREAVFCYDKKGDTLTNVVLQYNAPEKTMFEKEVFIPKYISQDNRILITFEESLDVEEEANPILVLVTLKE